MKNDIYTKLKVNPFNDEVLQYCSCDKPTYVLAMMVSYNQNPVRCINCLDVVDPASVPIPKDIVHELADWSISHSSIQWLAFQTDEYETWANNELNNIKSGINTYGLELRKKLSKTGEMLYWYTRPLDSNSTKCPICCTEMQEIKYKHTKAIHCSSCSMVSAPKTSGMQSNG